MSSHEHHHEIERLIPWYVNGTLNEAETDAVNEHLRQCGQCSASIEREVSRARTLRLDPPALERMGDGRDNWQTLAARLPRQRRRSPRVLAATAALSVIVAVAAGAFLIGHELQRPVYRAMTAPSPYAGPIVQLVFEPSTPEHVIRGVVLTTGGSVIAGPTATGIYRIGLPEGADGQAVAERLEQMPPVRWAALEQP